tara:strand:- start:2587 stop:3273 length:687 start_codon:yes stop_codon:yes gene_type:complete
MNYFYSNNIIDKEIILDEQETVHCVKVLRNKVGDNIYVVDGMGSLFFTEIIQIDSKKCCLKILKSKKIKNNNNVHLIISPTKNHKRIEWMIEKIVEIGVERVSFVICKNSIRDSINLDRLNKIALSAMKQTQNTVLTKIDDCAPFQQVIDLILSKEKYIAHLNKIDNPHLSSVLKNDKNRCILIGPEGDFANDEVCYALKNNFIEVSLGSSRLRTETAGMVSATILNL